eukprot:TRINITY_DN15510_c0_g2_i1.p1 TRINITY_DN15510_c0_g2~~TRINITY_DN15510_c0_g2_i1.p1  ORF type:complete len:163 (-),score=47.11 TRINITY_DN15510_c0_g2_i1:96-584(-)
MTDSESEGSSSSGSEEEYDIYETFEDKIYGSDKEDENENENEEEIENDQVEENEPIVLPEIKENKNEIFVVMDFSGVQDMHIIKNCTDYSLIALDTDTPILQIDGKYVFEGSYEQSVGTSMLFEIIEDENAETPEKNIKSIKYYGKTPKRIKWKPVTLVEKK